MNEKLTDTFGSDRTLESSYEYSLPDIMQEITPSSVSIDLLNAYHALTRLTANDTLTPADVAINLAAEVHGSLVTHEHIAALFEMAPGYFSSLKEEELRFFLICGINHSLADLQNRYTAAAIGLTTKTSEDICKFQEDMSQLQEKKGKLYRKNRSDASK